MRLNITDNGATAPFKWSSGRGTFTAWGDFGGGTATLQMSPDNGTTWINVDHPGDTYCTFTANGEGGFELTPCFLRVNLTGATSPNLTFRVN
jgi:hypothetical protein